MPAGSGNGAVFHGSVQHLRVVFPGAGRAAGGTGWNPVREGMNRNHLFVSRTGQTA